MSHISSATSAIGTPTETATITSSTPWLKRADWRRSWLPWIRGTTLGVLFGSPYTLALYGLMVAAVIGMTLVRIRRHGKRSAGSA